MEPGAVTASCNPAPRKQTQKDHKFEALPVLHSKVQASLDYKVRPYLKTVIIINWLFWFYFLFFKPEAFGVGNFWKAVSKVC